MTINPGSADAPPGTPEQAAQNLQTFLAEVAHRGDQPAGTPVRIADGDSRGRYAFDVPTDGDVTIRILMPGLAIEAIRDDLRASAPCILRQRPPLVVERRRQPSCPRSSECSTSVMRAGGSTLRPN